MSILRTFHLDAVELIVLYSETRLWSSPLFNYRKCLTVRSQLQSDREQRRASTVCSLKPPNEPCKPAPCLLASLFPRRIQIVSKFVDSNLLILHFFWWSCISLSHSREQQNVLFCRSCRLNLMKSDEHNWFSEKWPCAWLILIYVRFLVFVFLCFVCSQSKETFTINHNMTE